MEDTKSTIQKYYIEYVLENGRQPVSVYALAKKLNITEEAFYQHFNSFESLEQDVWKGIFDSARQKVESQEVYMQYTVREKLLSFYYTWIEELKLNRSFVLYTAGKYPNKRLNTVSPELYTFKKAFKEFAAELLREGRATEEVINRPYISDRYTDGLWVQVIFVLNFWIKDPSKSFEQTDVAIEKAVNTSFDFIGRTPLDSLFDFAKFLFQSRV
jgi:AcrR family transcriptional regulator